jgi:hypothetical protein
MNEAAHKGGATPIKPLAPQNVTKNASAAAVAGEAKAPKAPKAPKEPRESNFKKVYPDSAVITVLTPEGKNPKRPGCKAYAIFDLYAKGKTVGDFIKNGGRYSALSWDTGHGFIKVG